MITSIDAKKAYDKVQYPFIIKKKKPQQSLTYMWNLKKPSWETEPGRGLRDLGKHRSKDMDFQL